MRILIIEDDHDLSEMIAYTFREQNIEVDTCYEGDDGLRFIKERAYDLILLDWMLPRLDGLSILRIVREEGIGTPILMMTALGQVEDVIQGLESGADDYIIKPFHLKELVARAHAMSRRPASWVGKNLLEVEKTTFNPTSNVLSSEKKKVILSKKEAALMEFFLRHPNTILPRLTLFSRVWGPDAPIEEGNLENYIYLLRKQLKLIESNLSIRTVRGVGYELVISHV